jgi:hypothetical protein
VSCGEKGGAASNGLRTAAGRELGPSGGSSCATAPSCWPPLSHGNVRADAAPGGARPEQDVAEARLSSGRSGGAAAAAEREGDWGGGGSSGAASTERGGEDEAAARVSTAGRCVLFYLSHGHGE